MRRHELLYYAGLLQAHRDRLAEVAQELAERGEPLSELEAKLLADAGSARLLEVEGALLREAGHAWRPLRKPMPRVGPRVRSWTKPRIGRLKHYEPRPLLLPRSYFTVRPPLNPPTISIVTPSYEQGRFIGRTIQSVVGQGYPSFEYHVQDGGSSDETLSTLNRFDAHLTSWAVEPDAGQADAINRGFEHTSGEIMAWLNSDDLLLPGSLATVGSFFAAHPEVDVVYGNRIMIDGTDRQIGAWILPRHDDTMLTLADYIPQETLFWRRRIWDAAGGFVDPTFDYAIDWELLLRFREAGAKMMRIPRFLGAFRIHDEQKTTAQDAVGAAETARLRRRVHGRDVPIEEVLAELRPFFLRHIVVHSWQRLRDRLPGRRLLVETSPPALSTDRPSPLAGAGVVSGAQISEGRGALSPVAAGAEIRLPTGRG